MHEFVVRKINSLYEYDDLTDKNFKTLNLMDFTGYDALPKNGLEQLLINLGNEKYSDSIFINLQVQKEKKFMEDEGFKRFASEVHLLEPNTSLIKILESKEKPIGLLSLLTSIALSSRCEKNQKVAHKAFVTDIHTKLFKNSDHITQKMKRVADEFIINHSFYKVEYDPTDFIDLDRNLKLEDYFLGAVSQKEGKLVKLLKIYKEMVDDKRKDSLSDLFTYNSDQVKKDIANSDINYVFNIRANNEMEEEIFDQNVVIPQLKKLSSSSLFRHRGIYRLQAQVLSDAYRLHRVRQEIPEFRQEREQTIFAAIFGHEDELEDSSSEVVYP